MVGSSSLPPVMQGLHGLQGLFSSTAWNNVRQMSATFISLG
jgi:hypothetical protein